MTHQEMLDWIGVKCDDIAGATFPKAIRYIALNEAVKKVIDNVDNYYLRELLVRLSDQVLDSDGAIDISTFTTAPFSMTNGIVSVVTLETTGRPLSLISYEEYMDLVRSGTARYDNPGAYQTGMYYYYFIGTKIYCVPGNYNVDIYYIKNPAAISDSQDCVLDDIFHVDIAELAAAILLSNVRRQGEILSDIRFNYTNRAFATDSNRDDEFSRSNDFVVPRQILRIEES